MSPFFAIGEAILIPAWTRIEKQTRHEKWFLAA
jgi:hypothetical protein